MSVILVIYHPAVNACDGLAFHRMHSLAPIASGVLITRCELAKETGPHLTYSRKRSSHVGSRVRGTVALRRALSPTLITQ
jgi:hypothetical protein